MASTTTHTPSSSQLSSSSSSSSSSPSISNSNSSYDVFLSFRGEDTRYTFTDHLYKALKNHGINTFRDDEDLDRGAEVAPDLLKAIEGSKLSVVVFSENYAHSKWCLEELTKIMECNKERNQTVIPIFYHIDPSEVRNQRGSYGEAVALHHKGACGGWNWRGLLTNMRTTFFYSAADEEKRNKIQKWRTALSEAGNLAGHSVIKNEYESESIEKIIEFILKNLNSKLMPLDEKVIVGMDSRKKELKSLLDIYTVVGIYGYGGMGKTITAKIIYNDIISEFHGGSFLQNVREEFEKGHQLQLQQQLLRDTMGRDKTLGSTNEGINLIKHILHSKKVLIVADDVDYSEQLEPLIGSLEWFGKGSKVIITTRNQEVLSKYGGKASSYEIKGLNYDDAFQLFRWHAFEQNVLEENYANLSWRIINYVKGLPLAIKVLGSFLRDKTIDEWKSEFDKLRKNPNKHINNVLRRSFEGLDDIDKKVFLDIACFFKGEDKDFVSKILDHCGLFGKIGIRNLLNKCLITISEKNTIDMHDLVQQMGWAIVREENSNPYKGTRLWDPDDIYNVFFKKEGIENIEVISCYLSSIKYIKMNKQVLTMMKKLRLLRVYWSGCCHTLIFPKDFEFPSQELRYLYWEAYPLKTLPSSFEGGNLVELHLPRSNIKEFYGGNKILGKLKVINLRNSEKLVKMSKFRSVPNLEILDVSCCSSLRELDSSIGDSEKLSLLYLDGCRELSSLPSSMDALQSLEFLFIKGCPNLEKFPKIRGNMKRVRELDLRGSGITELPSNIQYLSSLKALLLSPHAATPGFFRLQTSIEYQSPSRFNVKAFLSRHSMIESSSWARRLQSSSGIKEIPSSIGYLTSLELLDVGGSGIRELPCSSKYLTSLEYLNLSYCSDLDKIPDVFGNMRHLRKLRLANSGIKELPRSVGGLESLETLDLSGCKNFEIFPEIQGNMKSLRHLYLQHTAIKQLPRSIDCLESLETLFLFGCVKLEKFPEIQRNMGQLKDLYLDKNAIKELPSSIDHLTGLESLILSDLKNLRSLPSSIYRMKSLKRINIYGCSSLESLPEITEEMEYLEELDLCEIAVKELPSSTENLRGLQSINLVRCENLVTLPDSIGDLTCLKRLTVHKCSNLQKLPDNLRSLQCCLEFLDVSGCKLAEGAIPSDLWSLYSLKYLLISKNDIRSIPAGIVQLSDLEWLYMNDCKLLEEIPELPSSPRGIEARGCPGPRLETLLNNQSSKLWSLQTLDVSQSDIRSIPAAIIQLSKLRTLNMSNCKLLEEITELPSSLRWIEAGGCPCLETSVSNPSSKLWSSLINCLKSCAEEAKCYSFRHYPWPDFHISLPGNNGIPEWVKHTNKEGEVTIDLPSNDNNFLGCAIFIHINSPLHTRSVAYARCSLTIYGANQSEEVRQWGIDGSIYRPIYSPEIFVVYVPPSAIPRINRRSNEWREWRADLSSGCFKERFRGTCKFIDNRMRSISWSG